MGKEAKEGKRMKRGNELWDYGLCLLKDIFTDVFIAALLYVYASIPT